MTDPRQRWAEVQPLPDRQGRVQQMDYLDGYVLALQDALTVLAAVAADLKTEPSPAQLGREVLSRAQRQQLAAMLNSARAKLEEIRLPVVLRTIRGVRHLSCVDILCDNPDPHTHL